MNLPKINSYILADTSDIMKKLIEEWYEVKICYLAYRCMINDKRRYILINKLIEELFDLLQIITTMSHACMFKIDKPTKINLSVNNLYHCTLNKIEFIDDGLQLNQLKGTLNHCYDFVYNILRIICVDNDINILEARENHLNKLKSRGAVWSE